MNAPTSSPMIAPLSPSASGASPVAASRWRVAVIAIGILIAVAACAAWAWHGDDSVTTDDAYVQGNIVQITPQVSGTVLSIGADDTDFVRAGQALVKLDPTDAKVVLMQAEAQLAQTVREVRTLFANNSTLKAQIALRDAEVARIQTDLLRAQDDVDRRAGLVDSGAVGREEFSHVSAQLKAARDAVVAAQAAATTAREQLASNESLTDNTTVADHPNVRRAAGRLREAWLACKRTELPAPVDGHVARRGVQVGQRVQAGAPLMTIVPLDVLWVDANFKENQLRRLRIGQRATLVADLYGSRIEYHGTVTGLGTGTGAAFSLLPAQNATGNWVKVVQRVPARIVLNAAEVAAHPLRVGLSMQVSVDVSDMTGKSLTEVPRPQPVASTRVFDDDDRDVDAAVHRIILDNIGGAGQKPRARPVRLPAAQ